MKQLRANLISKLITVLAVATLALVLGARTASSQGIVAFANTGSYPTTADRRVYDPITCAPLVGANWVAALYFGAESDNIHNLAVRSLDDLTLASAIARFRSIDPSHSLAGTWVGGYRFLLGTMVAQTLTMQVRVWDMSLFPTFEDAKAMGGYALESAPFGYVVPGSLGDSSALKMDNFQGITPPECIPEPSVFALAALGIGVLVAWRSRLAATYFPKHPTCAARWEVQPWLTLGKRISI